MFDINKNVDNITIVFTFNFWFTKDGTMVENLKRGFTKRFTLWVMIDVMCVSEVILMRVFLSKQRVIMDLI